MENPQAETAARTPAPARPISPTASRIACLLMAIGVSASATALYAEWLLAGIGLILPVTSHTVRRLLVLMLIVAAMIVGWFSPGAFLGIGAGLFIGIGLAVHILMLFSTEPLGSKGTASDESR